MASDLIIKVAGIAVFIITVSMSGVFFVTKANHTRRLTAYAAATSFMLLWSIVKLLQLTSPNTSSRGLYAIALAILAVLTMAASLHLLVNILWDKMFLVGGLIFALSMCMMLEIMFCWNSNLDLISVYSQLFIYGLFQLVVLRNRYLIFPETIISMEGIAYDVEDHVFVFDLSGALIADNLSERTIDLFPQRPDTIRAMTARLNQLDPSSTLEADRIMAVNAISVEQELKLQQDGKLEFYLFLAFGLKKPKGKLLGIVCVLRNITLSRTISSELEQRNTELDRLNLQLSNYLQIVDSLEEERERSELAREINSTIGQKLTEILSVLEVLKLSGGTMPDLYEKPLDEAIEGCREVISEIRVVVSKLVPDKNVEVSE